MRNLKRALSLTLASVMLLGMMVIGTSAASYPDVTEEHNVEAIEVLQAVGVMSGSDTGNFNPDSLVSRIEMAIVMSNLMNLKVDYFEGQCKFTDVPEWAGKYVAACEANGIVSGVGGGRYGTGNVTATQAALMMLKALGYFQYASDFEGGWDRNTARLASDLRLFTGMDVQNNTELTRNQVAQLALNTLKTPVVVPDDNTLHITTTVGGADTTVTSGKVTYKVTASNDAYAKAISAVEGSDTNTINGIQGAVIELGEKLYNGKLQLRENGRAGDGNVYDDFGRPARKWQYDGAVFGTYPKTEELRQEYSVKVSGKDLYDLLGSDIVRSIANGGRDDYQLSVTIDGYPIDDSNLDLLKGFTHKSMNRTNTDGVGDTGKGVLTQVFVDSVHHKVDIAIINTYLAKAEQNYVAKDDEVKVKVYKIDQDATSKIYHKTAADESIIVKGDKLDIDEVKKDDLFLVTLSQGEIKTMVAPEIVSETTINSFKEKSWAKNDDVQYDYASTARYDVEVLDHFDDNNMKGVTYNVILDKYGYLIGIEQNEAVNQYVFLTGLELGESNLSAKSAQGNIIFLDGTMQTVTINVEKSKPIVRQIDGTFKSIEGGSWTNRTSSGRPYSQLNTWCAYSVDDNGVYTLREVGPNANIGRNGDYSVRKAGQAAQTVDAANTNIAAEQKINTKNVSLDGAKIVYTTEGDFGRVYGNDETVYINVEMKGIHDKSGNDRMIVNKVKNTSIGIKSVDLTVKELTLSKTDGGTAYGVPANEIYTLYNKDGYIIGVVTLDAEDNGASANYAYIVGNVKQEDDLGGSKYRWSQEAIVNGKLVTLTEVGENKSYLDNNNKGLWLELTYDKDGNVNGIKSESAPNVKGPINFNTPLDQYLNAVSEVDNALNNKGGYNTSDKNLLLFVNYCHDNYGTLSVVDHGRATLHYENGTLYTTNDNTQGFWVSPNVKTVVLLAGKDHADEFDTKKDTYEGRDGLEQALDDLYGGKGSFDGYLSAIIEKGNGATTIILDERSGKINANWEKKNPMTITVNRYLEGTTTAVGDPVQIKITSSQTIDNTDVATPAGGYNPVASNSVYVTYVENGARTIDFFYTKGLDAYTGYIEAFLDFEDHNGTNTSGDAWNVKRIVWNPTARATGDAPTYEQMLKAVVDKVQEEKNLTWQQDLSNASTLAFKGTLAFATYYVKNTDETSLRAVLNKEVVLSGNPSASDINAAIEGGAVVLEEGANVTLTSDQAAALTADNSLTVKPGATLNISNDVAAPIDNAGTMTLSGKANGGVENTGTMTISADQGSTATVKNSGTMNVSSAQTGTIENAAGTLNVTANVAKVTGAGNVTVGNSGDVDSYEGTGTVTLSGSGTVTKAESGTVSIPATATGTVTTVSGTANVTSDKAATSITTVSTTGTVTLNGTTSNTIGTVTSAATIKANQDATITGAVSTDAKVEVAGGKTLTLTAPETLPTITTSGTGTANVKIDNTVNATETLDDLADKLGAVKTSQAADKAGTFTVTKSNVTLDKSSDGTLASWGTTIKSQGSDAHHKSLYEITLTGLTAGAKIKGVKTTTVTTNQAFSGSLNADGAGVTVDETGEQTFLLMLSTDVTAVVLTIQNPTPDGGQAPAPYKVTFNIGAAA